MVRSVNVKKTKSSKKIVLKITMSMTDICYHYIREVIHRKIVEVYFIEGEENPADLLTKNLGVVKF